MRNLVISYLFLKSLINPRFDRYDIGIAFLLANIDKSVPSFLRVIAGMTLPGYLPEARADILWELRHGRIG